MDFLIHHMLRRSATLHPDKEALVQGDTRMTYREVEEAAKALGSRLTALGVERGDRVGIFLEPSTSQAIAIFATSYAHSVFVPINHLLFPTQVVHIASDCGMKCLVTTKSRLQLLRPFL